ncbi:hypothetical protein HK405_009071, partial [Cladochytrium tenue]
MHEPPGVVAVDARALDAFARRITTRFRRDLAARYPDDAVGDNGGGTRDTDADAANGYNGDVAVDDEAEARALAALEP